MRLPWRMPGRAMLAALAGTALMAGFAGTASAQPDPPPVIPSPAPGVTPGAVAGSAGGSLLYTGTDRTVWTNAIAKLAGPPVPFSVTGRLLGAPAPLSTGSALVVFGEGTDHQLWYSTVTTGYSQPWYPLGGRLTSNPGVAYLGGGAYAVFVRGTDEAAWERVYNGTKWADWQRIGGRVLAGTAPTATYLTGSGHLYVGVVGTNRQVYLKAANLASGFFSIGGQTTANPALTAISATALAAFSRGTDGAGYYSRYTEGQALTGWHSMGGRFTSGLATASATVSGKVTTYTLGLGTDGQVYGDIGTWTPYPPAFSGWSEY